MNHFEKGKSRLRKLLSVPRLAILLRDVWSETRDQDRTKLEVAGSHITELTRGNWNWECQLKILLLLELRFSKREDLNACALSSYTNCFCHIAEFLVGGNSKEEMRRGCDNQRRQ